MNNLFILIMLVIFAFFVLIGLLCGLARGTKKAFIRIITLAVAFVAAALLTPLVSKILSNTLLNRTQDITSDINANVYEALTAKGSPFTKIMLSAFNPLVFIVVFFVLWFISLIAYWILGAIFGKRKVDEYGNKKSKGRLIGMLIGAFCGFIMFLWIFMPLNGYARMAGKIGTIENKEGNSILHSLDEEEILGFNVGVNEYYDSGISKSLGLGIDKIFFNYLTTSSVKGTNVTLSKEIDTFIKLYKQYNDLDGELKDFLEDPQALDALEEIIDTLFESKIVIVSLNYSVDYLIEHPELLKDIIEGNKESEMDVIETYSSNLELEKNIINADDEVVDSEKSLADFFTDEEILLTILNNLKGNNMKNTIKSCFNVIRVAQKSDINLTDFDTDSFENLNDESIEELVGAIIDVPLVRDLLPFMINMMYEPMAKTFEIEINDSRPVVTDWESEKTNLINIFKGINSLASFSELSGEDMENIEDFFTEKQIVTIGGFFDSFKRSELMSVVYDTLTDFNDDKNEYFIISFLDNLIFNDADTSNKSLRSLFYQSGAGKVNPSNPKDNINFKALSWTKLFRDISDMVVLVTNIKDLENISLTTENADQIVNIIKKLDELDKEMVGNVLEAFIPEDSGIVIPDLENVDFVKEAEIIEELFAYQNKFENLAEGETLSKEDVEDIIGIVAESEMILQILEASNTTVGASETEKAWIEETLENSDFSDDIKNAIKNLFDIHK